MSHTLLLYSAGWGLNLRQGNPSGLQSRTAGYGVKEGPTTPDVETSGAFVEVRDTKNIDALFPMHKYTRNYTGSAEIFDIVPNCVNNNLLRSE